jgi:hypothetical protein
MVSGQAGGAVTQDFIARVIVMLAMAISQPADVLTLVAGSSEETSHENSTIQMVPE